MAEYDSDESLSDQQIYTETGVMLGYASREPTDDEISHLGGHPLFMSQDSKPPGSFSRCKACNSFLSLLLQLNGDLPEHFPDHERRLYIFACRQRRCMRKEGSIRALRETRRWRASSNKNSEPSEPMHRENARVPDTTKHAEMNSKQELGGTIFGVSNTFKTPGAKENPFMTSNSVAIAPANPFAPLPATSELAARSPQRDSPPQASNTASLPESRQPSKSASSELPATFASKLQIHSDSQTTRLPPSDTTPWPALSSFPPPYPLSYLEADYETLDPTPATSQPAASSSSSTFPSNYDSEDSSKPSADVPDSTLDATFQRFSDRLSQNPSQVLRYEFAGTPLLYSATDAVASRFLPSIPAHTSHLAGASESKNKMPRCESCGAERVFECQLVPGAISALEDGVEGLGVEEGMEWGTVIVGVCSANCGSDEEEAGEGKVGWREEWCGVQWEERVVRK
ncbi:MAG: hypothetical protein Q9227_005047 [Pyrenula ochraceoflavens]